MTEQEWLDCTDPVLMLPELFTSERKSRLFACAYCRHLWHLLADEEDRLVVEEAERFCEGLVSEARLEALFHQALLAHEAVSLSVQDRPLSELAKWAAAMTASHSAFHSAGACTEVARIVGLKDPVLAKAATHQPRFRGLTTH
jgi:hypothetical protein